MSDSHSKAPPDYPSPGDVFVFELDYVGLALAFGCRVDQVEQEIRIVAAVRAYWLRRIPFEEARRSAGLSVEQFIEQLEVRGAIGDPVYE